MLISENDQPFLKGEYPLNIQGSEHEVVGQPKKSMRSSF